MAARASRQHAADLLQRFVFVYASGSSSRLAPIKGVGATPPPNRAPSLCLRCLLRVRTTSSVVVVVVVVPLGVRVSFVATVQSSANPSDRCAACLGPTNPTQQTSATKVGWWGRMGLCVRKRCSSTRTHHSACHAHDDSPSRQYVPAALCLLIGPRKSEKRVRAAADDFYKFFTFHFGAPHSLSLSRTPAPQALF